MTRSRTSQPCIKVGGILETAQGISFQPPGESYKRALLRCWTALECKFNHLAMSLTSPLFPIVGESGTGKRTCPNKDSCREFPVPHDHILAVTTEHPTDIRGVIQSRSEMRHITWLSKWFAIPRAFHVLWAPSPWERKVVMASRHVQTRGRVVTRPFHMIKIWQVWPTISAKHVSASCNGHGGVCIVSCIDSCVQSMYEITIKSMCMYNDVMCIQSIYQTHVYTVYL
jgi:hypothetical protein